MIAALARKHTLRILTEHDVNVSEDLQRLFPLDLGVAINFDQVIGESFIRNFNIGIVNLHASRLPRDRGISPVLWAFARGDREVWATVYRIDGALDSGPIYRQFSLPVSPTDTAFRLYERVCVRGGEELAKLIDSIMRGVQPPPKPQSREIAGNYWSWPNSLYRNMLKESGRRLFDLRDIARSIGN